jgi:hypothetical protein
MPRTPEAKIGEGDEARSTSPGGSNIDFTRTLYRDQERQKSSDDLRLPLDRYPKLASLGKLDEQGRDPLMNDLYKENKILVPEDHNHRYPVVSGIYRTADHLLEHQGYNLQIVDEETRRRARHIVIIALPAEQRKHFMKELDAIEKSRQSKGGSSGDSSDSESNYRTDPKGKRRATNAQQMHLEPIERTHKHDKHFSNYVVSKADLSTLVDYIVECKNANKKINSLAFLQHIGVVDPTKTTVVIADEDISKCIDYYEDWEISDDRVKQALHEMKVSNTEKRRKRQRIENMTPEQKEAKKAKNKRQRENKKQREN